MQEPTVHTAAPPPGIQTATLRVFLVDDNPIIRENLARTLEELAPVRVVAWAEGEKDALAWLGEHHLACDLMVVDMFLHDGSGMSLLKHVHAAGWHCKKVVMSNYINDEVRQACLALGAEQVLDKSWDIERLATLCVDLHHEPTGARSLPGSMPR